MTVVVETPRKDAVEKWLGEARFLDKLAQPGRFREIAPGQFVWTSTPLLDEAREWLAEMRRTAPRRG